MKIKKKLSSALDLTFYYDPKCPDEHWFVLEDGIYGDEIMLTSKEMVKLVDSVTKMKRNTVL
jgi:hypothetical protein